MPTPIPQLRDQMRAIAATDRPARRAALDKGAMDAALSGGLKLGALHEVYAANGGDAGAATGFSLGLALKAAMGKTVLWAREDMLDVEAGHVYAPGLMEFGLPPSSLVMVRARDGEDVLKAAEDAVRCGGLGAVIIQPWRSTGRLSLTVSRRLVLAATASGVTAVMLRIAAEPSPSAAETRWEVAAAPSRWLDGEAPGLPSFDVRLLRQRGGEAGQSWVVEWDRDCLSFAVAGERAAPLSRPVVPVSAGRTAGEILRRTG